FARVEVEHEVDQRSREPGAGSTEHRETRAGDLGRALEVDDSEGGPEIPVGLWLEVELAWLAVPPHFDVLRRPRADRHARLRQVRQDEQRLVALILDGIELNAELPDLL